jgi:hypothetical protein
VFPSFLVIGAQKAGTSWLHRNLRAHPQVWMPDYEVHYFDRIDEPPNRGRSGERRYASLFEPGLGKVVGETTPGYSIVGRDTVVRAHRLMPEAKIIFMMRNPVERAWSQAVMRFVKREGGVEHVTDAEMRERFDHRSSKLRTDYLRTLQNWGTCYPPESIFVGFLEDVHFHPEELLRRLYGFLGVDPGFVPRAPKLRKRINARSTDEMPTRVAVHLAHTYLEDARRLEERFGGYASFWRYCAQRLVEDPPEDEALPYPLWKMSTRGGSVSGVEAPAEELRGVGVQSATLASFRAVR